MKSTKIIFFLLIMGLFMACEKTERVEESEAIYDGFTSMNEVIDLGPGYDYSIDMPQYLNNLGLFPTNFSDIKASLGRVIFYDTDLSSDGTISCASCHKQEIAFADDAALSQGIQGRLGNRNSLALGSVINFSAYYGPNQIQFFWDERASTAEEQAKESFENPDEMNMSMAEVVDQIRENEQVYTWLFEQAYGSKQVTEQRVLEAVAEFVNAMGSFSSPFDKGMNEADGNETATFANFNAQENQGKAIFMQNCATCHSTIAGRSTQQLSNNGLDVAYTDNGVGNLTSGVNYDGIFKTPSLRNVSATAPYMHDGRFGSLEEVIEHYSTGIKNHPNLGSQLKTNNNPTQFNYTGEEKTALLAFLHTLTDQSVMDDPKFSDPFRP